MSGYSVFHCCRGSFARHLTPARSQPCRMERVHRREPFISLRPTGLNHDVVEGLVAAKGREIQRAVRQKHGYDPTHCEQICDFVYSRAEFELLRRHETRRPEHASHIVCEGPIAIQVQVYQMEGLISKVINHGAVIKVSRHPSKFSDAMVKVEHDVQCAKQSGEWKCPKTLKGRGRIRSLGAFNPDELSRHPLINQHGTVWR